MQAITQALCKQDYLIPPLFIEEGGPLAGEEFRFNSEIGINGTVPLRSVVLCGGTEIR